MGHQKRNGGSELRKLRSQNEKNSLSDLSRMLADSKVFKMIKDEEDILTQEVWKIVSDGRERTAEEVKALLDPKTDLFNVVTTLKVLETKGKLIGRHLPPEAQSDLIDRTYVVKPGADLEINTVKPQRKTLGINTMASKVQKIILATDSIDVSIWKAMSDLRSRKLDEIADILSPFGWHRVNVKDRVVLLANKGWFARKGHRTLTTYVLQKSIRIPESGQDTLIPVEEQKVDNTAYYREVAVAFQPTVAEVVKEEPAVEIITEPKVNIVTAISKDDASDVAIWKVMHDFTPMLPSEVGFLLEEFGFKTKSIATRIGTLYNHYGWFDRKEEGRTYSYTLKQNIPCPEGALKDSDRINPETVAKVEEKSMSDMIFTPTESTKQGLEVLSSELGKVADAQYKDYAVSFPDKNLTPEQTKQLNTSTKEENSMNSTADNSKRMLVLNQAPQPEKQETTVGVVMIVESSLLSFHAKIKNTSYTIDQLCILVRELIEAGYGEGRFVAAKPGLLVTTHQIRGESFTDKELEDLCGVLKVNNFHLYKKM